MPQINTQESQLQKAEGTITTMQGEMEQMRSKIEEALKLIEMAKKLEEKIVSVQHRREPLQIGTAVSRSIASTFFTATRFSVQSVACSAFMSSRVFAPTKVICARECGCSCDCPLFVICLPNQDGRDFVEPTWTDSLCT